MVARTAAGCSPPPAGGSHKLISIPRPPPRSLPLPVLRCSKDHKRWPIPALQDRQYDVTFIGKLQYEAKDAVSGVTAHR